VAGVREIVLVTPPGPGGRVEPAVLAAARLAGVTEGYRVGGAQAVAALAYGTATIRRVDKIVGPGNIYVALAKARVFGEVGIDMVAGPSEIVVVADAAADPAWVACAMRARSSWAATPPRWLATTSPDPTTSCRPQARRASPRRSARRISSSARASSSTRRVGSPPPRRISGCSRGSKGSPDTGAPP